jgi:hypothetical protein
MNSGVPPSSRSLLSPASAKPKSVSLRPGRTSSTVHSKTFCGLRSLWITPRAWACASAPSKVRSTSVTMGQSNGGYSFDRSPPLASSMASHGLPAAMSACALLAHCAALSSTTPASSSSMTCGCCRRATACTSFLCACSASRSALGGSTFTATGSSRRWCRARHTMPAPPEPTTSSSRKRPSGIGTDTMGGNIAQAARIRARVTSVSAPGHGHGHGHGHVGTDPRT